MSILKTDKGRIRRRVTKVGQFVKRPPSTTCVPPPASAQITDWWDGQCCVGRGGRCGEEVNRGEQQGVGDRYRRYPDRRGLRDADNETYDDDLTGVDNRQLVGAILGKTIKGKSSSGYRQ